MLLGGFIPHQFTLCSIVSTCAELGFVSVGQQLHSWVVKMGLCLDDMLGAFYWTCIQSVIVESQLRTLEKYLNECVILKVLDNSTLAQP